MRWEKLQIQSRQVEGGQEVCGPGKRWGHTCNSVGGGKLLYVFGGYGKDNCQTNQVHVFDTVKRTWSEPIMKGTPPTPRDSHSCSAVGDNLFVFGGTDGMNPLKDLHILDTTSNTWISPSLRGDGPEAREGHSAALIGKRLFIFGGCGKSSNNYDEEHYDDLYILNTETFVWKRAVTSGSPPAKRDSHTCSSWKSKIVVIGGEDTYNYYLSDVHILDADTLIWSKLNTSGELLPPRAGHTTVALGKNFFVFGGFTDEQNLYDDIYMLDIDTGLWTKVMATGEGPSARFSMAGDSLDPEKGGVLVFTGGCNKNLDALDDMFYLHTGLAREERDERRLEKLSLRKQLKLKCQEQQALSSVCDKALVRFDPNADIYQPMHVPSYIQESRHNVYLNEYQPPPGKRTFQAKVIKSFPDVYSIETVIDGKPLRGVLFSNKPSFSHSADDNCISFSQISKKGAVEVGGINLNDDRKSKSETARPLKQDKMDDRQAGGVHGEMETAVASDTNNPATSDVAHLNERVSGNIKPAVAPNLEFEGNESSDVPNSNTEVPKENIPTSAEDCVTLPPNQDGRALNNEECILLIENHPPQSV
ncbi:nitrile-specifier protein 5 isoform X2 [Cornus florida]|uniref:nitrile-specifier protein 5 isoform X2 n=1 Tax=Cornus florida TaxID=4283 RepID=UPI002896F6BA|nr:nitrile-specifier protein 5 isoform X2 [Cornus florida]